MSETKSKKLKLQLPSHHVYDLEDWSQSLEAPNGLIISSSNFGLPIQRRRINRTMRSGDASDSSQFMMKENNQVPQTPPSPSHNAALYPFLRLHRQMSSSSPDVRNAINNNRTMDQSDVGSNNNNGTTMEMKIKNRSFTQPHNLNLLANTHQLSEAVAQNGLTAAIDKNRNPNQESTSSHNRSRSDGSTNDRKLDRNEYDMHSSMKNGFFTNLIFGNKNVFGNQPLKVSAFDMAMCAPGST